MKKHEMGFHPPLSLLFILTHLLTVFDLVSKEVLLTLTCLHICTNSVAIYRILLLNSRIEF